MGIRKGEYVWFQENHAASWQLGTYVGRYLKYMRCQVSLFFNIVNSYIEFVYLGTTGKPGKRTV